MAYAALVLQVLFLLAALVLRTALHAHRTGSTGFRLGAGGNPVESLAAAAITLAGLCSAAAVVLDLLGALDPLGFLDQPALNIGGGDHDRRRRSCPRAQGAG